MSNFHGSLVPALALMVGATLAAPAFAGDATLDFLPDIGPLGIRAQDGTLDSLSPDGTMVALHRESDASPRISGFWSEADGEVTFGSLARVAGYFDAGVAFAPWAPGVECMWQRGIGLVEPTELFPAFTPGAVANGVSPDASTLVGFVCTDESCTDSTAAVWRRDGSMDLIEQPPGAEFEAAWFTSRDGSVVVGLSDGGQVCYVAFVWTPEDGRLDFAPPPGFSFSEIEAISEDGSTIAGVYWSGQIPVRGLAGGATADVAASTHPPTEPFVWTRDGGVRPLGPPPPVPAPYLAYTQFGIGVQAISSDGSVVLGHMRAYDESGSGSYSSEFLWSEAAGMVDARAYLAAAIYNPFPDIFVPRVYEVIDMSADARRFLVYAGYEYIGPDDIDNSGARGAHDPRFADFARTAYCDDIGQPACPAFVTLPSACRADLDRDNDTDIADFSLFVENFDTYVAPGTHGDLNRDFHVDVLDFPLFALNFGCAE